MADKQTAPVPAPVPAKAPAPVPTTPIDQAEHGRVRKPHGGAVQ